MKKTIKQYTIDAFADNVFQGNPAAVCVLDDWLPDETLLHIAQENNLSETAFVKAQGNDFALRWFTPTQEIDLCGHATLATAFALHEFVAREQNLLRFHTVHSGILTVEKQGDLFAMDFPAYALHEVAVTDTMQQAIGFRPQKAFLGRDLLCILENEQQILDAKLDFSKIAELDGALLHITAAGSRFDCVSRSFAPKIGIDEDPVCGSGHCHILPYWANVFQKNELSAYQASARGGQLWGTIEGKRLTLKGKAVLFAKSEIYV